MNDFWKNKNVLITGHTGFKGSWLSSVLIQLGAKVIGISIDIPTNPSHFDYLNLSKKIFSVRGEWKKRSIKILDGTFE